ncbi:MAG: ribonuclease [Gaiellales bacterium]|nr:ribonuclease [Gaiellales bacterium]
MTVIANTTKTILISADLSELRVAVLEEGRTVETYIERRGSGSIAGNIYKAKIDNVLPSIDAAFVDFGASKNGFLQVKDVELPGLSTTARRRKKISDLLSPGQEILVQIEKNPMKTKGARVTMELSIAGRFLVITPGGEGSGVSKRLPDGERERLRKLVKGLEAEDVGVIVRTAAAGATKEDLERDLRFLRKIWAQVESRAKSAPAKSLVHQDGDLSLRIIRDLLTRNVDKVVVDSERQFRRILGWVRTTQPDLADRIQLHSGSQSLFEQYGVEAAIRSTLNRRVDLPSGGYLLFDYAEAFTVIDVNSGSSNRAGGLEDTTLRTNVEAAREVMRQLRLRDIGGIIVIDFIDMEREKNRKELVSVLQEELAKDRTKTYLVDISPLGLVEMTRQNVTEGVRETLTSVCPTCGGEGRVLSQDTMAVEAERKLRKIARTSSSEAFRIRLNAKVAAKLAGPGGVKLLELERELSRRFSLEPEMRLPLEEVDVVAEGPRAEIDGDSMPVKEGEEQMMRIAEPHMFNLSDGVARLNGYPVVVGGAINYVGQDHRVRIERAMKTMAFATLLDAKPMPIELPPEPGDLELPDLDREVGERLELEDRTRGRRPRRTTTAPSRSRKPKEATDDTDDEVAADAPEVVEAGAEAEAEPKPKRRRSRGGRGRTKAGDAATETTEAAEQGATAEAGTAVESETAVDSAPAEGDAGEEPAKPKRRRGTRGGRGRSKTAATTNGDAPGTEEAAAEVEQPAAEAEAAPAAAEKPAPKPRARRTTTTTRTRAKPKPKAAAEDAPAAGSPPPAGEGEAPTAPAVEPATSPVAEPAPAPAADPAPSVDAPASPETPPASAEGDQPQPQPRKRLLGRLLGDS